MNRNELKQTLRQPYCRESWSGLLRTVFGEHIRINAEAQRLPAEDDCIQSIAQIGDVLLSDGKQLAIIEVEVGDDVNLLRNRVGLRNRVARFIDQDRAHGVLAVFSSSRPEYRFSFTAREVLFDEELGMFEKETATKRFTYVLGPGESCTTAAQRFERLSEKHDQLVLDDVVEAFSVEKLNKEFFNTYKDHYERFCGHLLSDTHRKTTYKLFGIPSIANAAEQARQEKPVRDFVKRLLGRIVFLHFLQKKGWMGCPADRREWTGGDLDFLHTYFQKADDKDAFHSHRLLPLFYEALNQPGRNNDIFSPTGTRIPYLNGGLFEQAKVDEAKIDFPPGLFADLLDFFRQFNFTIDENDPDEHEVGIDPEMLGHIFENLLEDNKDKGAYYTPKAIVHYMCQQSLLYYLLRHLGESDEARAALEYLVRSKQTGEGTPHAAYIRANAARIEELIDGVKVCDPAIGSGAFPIGILQEIFWIKLTLDLTLNQPAQLAEVKRGIIQNSIYGVDKDAGAVDIARLRFWLSLVVDETEPRPLPNLDYKIMQGDSLVESFEGIPLHGVNTSRVAHVRILGQEQLNMGFFADTGTQIEITLEEKTAQDIHSLIKKFFSEISPETKQSLHREIDRLVLRHLDERIEQHRDKLEIELQQTRLTIQDKERKLKTYKPTAKENRRLRDLTADLETNRRRKAILRDLESRPERPFFLWHLYFQDVFEKGGFDIVIANPPYVRQEVIKDYKPLLEAEGYACFTGTADLFVYFYERSVKMLNDQGVLTFITSNKYYRSGYGEKLREFLARELTLRELLDFGDAPVFDAIAYASILVGTKEPPPDGHALKAWTWQRGEKIGQVARVMAEKAFPLQQGNLTPDGWGLERPEVFALLKKLREKGTPLGDYVQGRFYRGILTGLNEAFVVPEKVGNDLLRFDSNNKDILRPFLEGREIKRWKIQAENNQLLFIPWHFPLHNDQTISGASSAAEEAFKSKYPEAYNHLHRHYTSLSNRSKSETGIRYEWYALQRCAASYSEYFDQPKIVWGNLATKPQFAYTEIPYYLGAPANLIPTTEIWLLGFLNSFICHYVILKSGAERQNGFYEFKPMYVGVLPIPKCDDFRKKKLEQLSRNAAQAEGPELERIEDEINRIVYDLFELTPAETRLIESTIDKAAEPEIAGEHGKTRDKDSFFRRLRELSAKHPYVSFERIKEDIREDKLVENDYTFHRYLGQAIDAGILHDAGRRWYTRNEREARLSSQPIEELSALLETRFPLLPHYIWSPLQFNPWLHNQLGHVPGFVYVDADGLDDMAEFLREKGWEVNLNPGRREAIRIGNQSRDVVLRPVSRELEDDEPTIETALVDFFLENERHALIDPTEFRQMVRNILTHQRINLASLLRKLGDKKRPAVDFLGEESVQYLGDL